MYKALQAFVLKSAYNVLKITNALKCLSASTSTTTCGGKCLKAPPNTPKNVLKMLSSTSIQEVAPCLYINTFSLL